MRSQSIKTLGPWSAAVVLVAAGSTWAFGQPCIPEWSAQFAGGDVGPYPNALAVFDDGSGPGLYIAGSFDTAGGVSANGIARWDGTTWSALGGGLQAPGGEGIAYALTVFDDGTGSALYVGGAFTTAGGVTVNHIAKWDGKNWAALGAGLDLDVLALAVFDDGSGPALYAAGSFTMAVAKWDGTAWWPIGGELWGGALALAVFDDGTGPALYANGALPDTDYRLVKWNGSHWSGVATLGGPSDAVYSITVFEDGSGPALFATGYFTKVNGVGANSIARWDGANWSPLGSGLTLPSASVGIGESLAVFDDGGGAALYVTGSFRVAGGINANCIARWDGASWSALGSGFDDPQTAHGRALAVFDDGTGPALYACGLFTSVGGIKVNDLAKWNGTSWSALGAGMNSLVRAFAAFDDGNGPALYAGGEFTRAGAANATRIAKWNGTNWSALGTGLANAVYALATFDAGSGPGLYAAGKFGGGIRKWNGTTWTGLSSGLNHWAYAATVFDYGSGPALYVGGQFTTAGGVTVNRIAKWNGANWSGLGGADGTVWALAVFDDGRGPALYAGGSFDTIGGVSASHIAKWDGTSWSALGSGVDSTVLALAGFDDGSGPALYAAGHFTSAGDVSANYIAKWDSTSWSALGDGVSNRVYALAVFDDGSGPALYAGGYFTAAGDASVKHIAKWDGASWSALSSGLTGAGSHPSVYALAVFDEGNGPGLYAGGDFLTAGSTSAAYVARWSCPPVTFGRGDVNCDGVINAFDIDPFVLALTDPAGYAAAYPNCNINNADIDCDGTIGPFDIDPFVQCLTAGCPPCP